MVEFDPYSHKVHDDPYPYYKALRDEAPAYFNEEYGVWILSRYDDVQMALRDFKTFSNCEGVALGSEMTDGGFPMILTMDPPKHTKLRKIVSGLLTPQVIASTEPYIREKAIALLEPHLATGKIDMLSDFAVYLPMAVISRMVKIPESDEDMVRHWTDALVFREEKQVTIGREAVEAYFKLAEYMDKLIKKHWDDEPDGSLIGAIIDATKKGELSHEEVIGFMILLGVAGNETTTKLIGNMTYRLWEFKDQRQKLVEDLSLMSNAIEETMRFDGSTQLLGRKITQDVQMHGQTLKAGQRVGLLLISANRDERKFENPDNYDITRKTMGHMGFGFGIHSCVGAALARLEAKVAFEEILKRIPDFELDPSTLERMHSPNVRGYTHVPLTFTPVK